MSDFELKIHDIGVTSLLFRLASKYGRDWEEEDRATINEAVVHAASLHDMKAVKTIGGVLSLEPKDKK